MNINDLLEFFELAQWVPFVPAEFDRDPPPGPFENE